MSENIKETPKAQEDAPEEKRKLGKKEICLIVCAVVALVGIITGIIVAIILNGKSVEPDGPVFNILDDDLSEYIEIDAKYYKDYVAEVDHRNLKLLVENEIIKTLCTNKDKKNPIPEDERDGIISVGDVVNIFYKGYYLNGEERVYFSGGSNIGGASYKLEIGSGSFVPGFEYNMIGKNPADYDESNPLIVEVYFPEKYQSTELAGKTAWFEVTVEKNSDGSYKMTEYNAPELTEEFLTETLLVTADQLADYEGETLVEKYRARERTEYMAENGYDVNEDKEEAFWTSVMAGAVVKKYPEKLLEEMTDAVIARIEDTYNGTYYSYYYTLDEFGCLYLGISSGDWRSEAVNAAKLQVKQQLVFYHIMNVEGLKPTAAEYDALFNEYFEAALEEQHIIPDRYDTNEEYEAAKEKYKADIIAKNGEDYFKTLIYYQIGMDAILSYGTVNIIE